MAIFLCMLLPGNSGTRPPLYKYNKRSNPPFSGSRWDFGVWRLSACFSSIALFLDTLDWTTSLSGKNWATLILQEVPCSRLR